MRTASRPRVSPALWQRWVAAVRKEGLIARGERVLAAVSGGPDSVALLYLLCLSAERLGITVAAAHLDHGWRGEASRADLRFVQDLGRKLDIPVIVESLRPGDLGDGEGSGPEAAARDARYAFLSRAAEAVGAHKIATGHTADDQAETLLLRLLRGSGGRGLRSILLRREDRVIRPLLTVRRSDLIRFLSENQISFRIDSTNADLRYTRNRIRREILPLLEAINPSIVETLARQAALLARDEACLTRLTDEAIRSQAMEAEGEGVSIPLDLFRRQPEAIRDRILLRAMERLAGGGAQGGLLKWEGGLSGLLAGPAGRRVWLGGGIVVERGYDRVRVIRPGKLVPAPSPAEVPIGGCLRSSILKGSLRTVLSDHLDRRLEGDAKFVQFDLDKLPLPLVLRTRRRGDVICPAGMGGHRKRLSRLMMDLRIPRALRDSMPILATSEGVVWVIGRRADGRFLADGATRRILVVSCEGEIDHA